MLPKKKIVVHNVYNKMMIELESVNEASRWFYENNISKSKGSSLSNIRNSLKDQRVIYKQYYLTYKK